MGVAAEESLAAVLNQ